ERREELAGGERGERHHAPPRSWPPRSAEELATTGSTFTASTAIPSTAASWRRKAASAASTARPARSWRSATACQLYLDGHHGLDVTREELAITASAA